MGMLVRALSLAALFWTAALANSKSVVVLELFTSEGCSSCPPADQLLSELNGRNISGAEIIALSQHVDYWDHLGWRDPFSSPHFTARQQAYGEVFKLETVFTPQLIVDGLSSVNGSDHAAVQRMIRFAADQPKASVVIERTSMDGRVSVRVEQLKEAKVESADVFLAITESGLASPVPRGENAGRMLRHTGVVRTLMRIVEIEAKRGAYVAELQLKIEPAWKRHNTRAVIFVQDQKTRRIVGAASCSL